MAATEDRLSFARDFADHRVATYHVLLETLPSALVASAFDFERRRLFAVEGDGARHAPDADLATGDGA